VPENNHLHYDSYTVTWYFVQKLIGNGLDCGLQK